MNGDECDLRDVFKVGQRWRAIPGGMHTRHRRTEVRVVESVTRRHVLFNRHNNFSIGPSATILECSSGLLDVIFNSTFGYRYERLDQQRRLF